MCEFISTTIGECCEILDSFRIPLNEEERNKIPGNIPYYGANGIQGYIDKYIFDEDLILIAEDGGNFESYETRPIAYRISGKSWVNNHAHILRALKRYNQDYIFYSLVNKNILNYIVGGTRSKLNQRELKTMTVSIPQNKSEQTAIAHILSTVDKAIEQTEKVIAKYKRIKTGLMQNLLTKGIDENGNIRSEKTHKFKDSTLGRIPVEWDVKQLFNCCDIIISNVDKKSNKNEVFVKLCNYLDVYLNEKITNKLDFMSATATQDEINKFSLQIEDVLITKDSETPDDIAVSAVVSDYLINTLCGYHLALIRPAREKFSGKFLNYLLSHFYYKRYFGANANGSTRFGLSLDSIKSAQVLLPSIDEQKNIVALIESISKNILYNEDLLKKYQKLKSGLMQNLLTGKVRVPEELIEEINKI